ncbi:hypothetical protein M413DRAFT_393596 [Hebeloma cylindrosporum]|uniref:Uncharacterized protein n=1 Tax=Hebeloma cylindrosporum TaxID=76867 RepID=A0A0C2XZH2_HEBCY|nr:hypothetical protein M413DRAFT_393596 [Hebeloma cylindrosporum h7]
MTDSERSGRYQSGDLIIAKFQKHRINCYASMIQRQKEDDRKRKRKKYLTTERATHRIQATLKKECRVSEGHRSFKYRCLENAFERRQREFSCMDWALALSTHELLA